MEHAIIFMCIQMQLQTMLCYDMIFVTVFKMKHKLYTASGSVPSPPNEKFWVHACL